MIQFPDLLSFVPSARIDLGVVRQALVFSFAAGGSTEAFDEAVSAMKLPGSTWQPAAFSRDLYVSDLAGRCLAVTIGGQPHPTSVRYVARVLSRPPRDRRDVETRHEILKELSSVSRLREDLERTYLATVRVRSLLGTTRSLAPRVRRMEILRAVRDGFDVLANSFDGATSALGRLRGFGRDVVKSEAYSRLGALLDHDDAQGCLDLRVRIGADGEVRAMEIVAVRENAENPFHVSVVRRFLTRLGLFVRGYRTTGGEVAERLLSDVFSGLEEPIALLFQVLGDAEVLLGSLGFRDRATDAGLSVSLPDLTVGEGIVIEGLFNPLLLASGTAAVPCDLHAEAGAVVLVTGPNSGGKTRLLQAVGIAQLFAESGLFVPARGGRLPRATGLFALLFEDARSDQPEGHLGMELLRIRKLFEQIDRGAVVVLDELCSGTNPSEGEEIARLVLSLLPELGVQAFVTTHLLQFAAELARSRSIPSLEFLQVEIDASERPTYRFVPGVARTSLAQRTAERLGVTRGELVEQIERKKSASRSPL
ncbi:MAG: DNA mismatch repair protein [Polyangiaceae bacterium]|jgi:DNA mismatch repair protein MutS2